MRLASFPGSGSSDKFGAIFQCLLAVKGALRGTSTRLMRKGRLGRLEATFSNLEKNKEVKLFPSRRVTYIQHSHQLTKHSFDP